VKFEISPSSKLYINLVIHLQKYVDLVILTRFCMLVFEMFTPFDTYSL